MTKSEALARVYERYSEEELRNAKDEPEHDAATGFTGRSNVVALFDDLGHATRKRVKSAFHKAGHGKTPADAIANARRIFRQSGSIAPE